MILYRFCTLSNNNVHTFTPKYSAISNKVAMPGWLKFVHHRKPMLNPQVFNQLLISAFPVRQGDFDLVILNA